MSTRLLNFRFLLGFFMILWLGLYPAVSEAQGLMVYTPYPKVTVPPGENVDFSVDLINKTGSLKTANLHISGFPKDWTYELKSGGMNVEQIAVLPGDKKNLSFTVQIPGKVNKGTYRFVLEARGLGRLPLTIEVSEQGNLNTEFSTDQANIEGSAKSTFTYNATLRNRTSEDQVYVLMAQAPRGWEVAFKANGKQVSSVRIEANQMQNISVEVDPADQAEKGKYRIPLRASTSLSSDALELEAVITGSYNIELSTPTGRLSTDISAGGKKQVELVVRNTGSSALKDVQMTASAPVNWEVTFDPQKITTIEPGKTQTVYATIQTDRKSVAGDYMVRLESKTPEASAEATFRVAVKTPLIWGWMGILLILIAVGAVYYLFKKYGRR